MDELQRGANRAIVEMRKAWPLFPAEQVTVHSLPVVGTIDPWATVQANGIYWPDGRWVELRCEHEFVIEHEMYHALGHQMRLPCWRTMTISNPPETGHYHNLDCSLK